MVSREGSKKEEKSIIHLLTVVTERWILSLGPLSDRVKHNVQITISTLPGQSLANKWYFNGAGRGTSWNERVTNYVSGRPWKTIGFSLETECVLDTPPPDKRKMIGGHFPLNDRRDRSTEAQSGSGKFFLITAPIQAGSQEGFTLRRNNSKSRVYRRRGDETGGSRGTSPRFRAIRLDYFDKRRRGIFKFLQSLELSRWENLASIFNFRRC